MELIRYARAGNWPAIAGYLLFVGMMAVGYAYNVTFIQLGLTDLGLRVLGMERPAVAGGMAGLALVTCLVALLSGWLMWRRARGGRPLTLRRRLQIATGVIAAQTLLTAVVTAVDSTPLFYAWLLGCAATLGVGVPITFSFTVDLIPMRDRGLAAALITAGAYLGAAARPGDWHVETFRWQMLLIMVPGLLALAVLAFWRHGITNALLHEWTGNAARPRFARGRYVRGDGEGLDRRFLVFIMLMFAVFFIDSLGFLRIVETPMLVNNAWLAGDTGPRLTIGVAHVVTALAAGVLYTSLGERHLFFWIFGVFALAHFAYVLHEALVPASSPALGVPVLYAAAVSLYTVINFALWADFSTPDTIGRNAALGVALSGWTATFLSTALAIQWQTGGMPVAEHLRLTNALALLFFLGMLILLVAPRWPRRGRLETLE